MGYGSLVRHWGAPPKATAQNAGARREQARQQYQDEVDRIPIEGKFGQAKRRFSLGRIMAKLARTSEAVIAIIFIVMNLEKGAQTACFVSFCILQDRTDLPELGQGLPDIHMRPMQASLNQQKSVRPLHQTRQFIPLPLCSGRGQDSTFCSLAFPPSNNSCSPRKSRTMRPPQKTLIWSKRISHRFGHLYSPVRRICAHPSGEICDRSSGGLSRPSFILATTVRPR